MSKMIHFVLLLCKAFISSLSLPDLRVVMAVITVCTTGMIGGSSFPVVAADSTEGHFKLTKAQCDADNSTPENRTNSTLASKNV